MKNSVFWEMTPSTLVDEWMMMMMMTMTTTSSSEKLAHIYENI
jgi:hypothetical protein